MDVNEYLNAIWFGNTVRTWLIAAGILLAAIAVLMASKALIVGRFFKFASLTSNGLDDIVVELLHRTRLTVIVIMVVAAVGMALLVLTPGVRTAIRFIAVIALFFQGMSWGNGLISFWTQRYAARRGMTSGPSAS